MDISASESGIIIPEGQWFHPEFTDFEPISQGRFNTIVKAKRQGRLWVLKGLAEPVRNSHVHLQLLRKEFEIMSSMQHPGIAMAVGFEDVSGLGPCIVMEWIDGVTLKEWIRSARSKDVRLRAAFQIMDALEYIHGLQTAHRDLKPSNIMITRNGSNVKLIDFGLSDTDGFTVYKQPAGTEGYISPEQASSRITDVRNDIYSFGCILEDMGLGKPWIVRRCKASASRRYGNVSEVRRAFGRVSFLKRSVGLAAIAAVALICGYLISAVPAREAGRRHAAELEVLRDEQKALLDDQEARRIEDERKAFHETEIEAAIVEGKRLMDSVIARVDLDALDTWEKASVIQVETVRDLNGIWESYPKSLGPAFTDTERENIRSILTTHWSEIMKPLTERVRELASTGPQE